MAGSDHHKGMSNTRTCRDCEKSYVLNGVDHCPFCTSPRFIQHPELHTLTIAHLDCDAFFASVEKRDDPYLADKPLIIGGGKRGVVSTCCYIARQSGVHSAMPMFQALSVCPDAVVLKPNIAKYRKVGEQVRALMRETMAQIEPVSIDEAYLDLQHLLDRPKKSPALSLIRLTNNLEQKLGISASVGLAPNKFLAKLASDFDKPRGFSIIGKHESISILGPLPVRKINGVGPVLANRLAKAGITTISQLQNQKEEELVAQFGSIGHSLANFSRGHDPRPVKQRAGKKTISSETTFETDINDFSALTKTVKSLSDRISVRLKNSGNAAQVVVLKMKTSDFQNFTRTTTLPHRTQQADLIFNTALHLLKKELSPSRKFRLIGIGVSKLGESNQADPPYILDLNL
jgi:DNA polymerase-4